MNATASGQFQLLRSRTALVVEPDAADMRLIVSMLAEAEFRVTIAERFADAKALLAAKPPDLLITDVRLGEYNGLHLVLRGKSARPDMVALVLSNVPDAVLHADAARFGATFVVKPLSNAELRAAMWRSISRGGNDDPPILPPFERRLRDRRAPVTATGVFERRVADRRRTAIAAAPLLLAVLP